VNGGYTFVTRDRDLDFWVAAGSVEYRVTKEWSLVGEIVCGLGIHGVHRTPSSSGPAAPGPSPIGSGWTEPAATA
jgi:hypothetical protein